MAGARRGSYTKRDVEFDLQCAGKAERGYSFNLTSLEGVGKLEDAVKKVKEQINATLNALDPQKSKIKSFFIGKTSTVGLKGRPSIKTSGKNSATTINHKDKNTMAKDHICSRWEDHMRNRKDGMVVVTVITEEIAKQFGQIPEYDRKYPKRRKTGSPKSNTLKCALYIESELQRYYQTHNNGYKLEHTGGYHPGPYAKDATAFPLYIAFTYKSLTQQTSMQQIQTVCFVVLTHTN